ncbi:MAG: YceI family protein [Candidatus Obscuribacter phosphatis]|uniref:YceI family protein n=1 Tax=Candidatus Obscuribacter phosphatis TaxID=1906157 RepID=A0A8J7TKH2_9BACT|nr:YceI family protein [Candidatus Obscuribacter phosphatis]
MQRTGTLQGETVSNCSRSLRLAMGLALGLVFTANAAFAGTANFVVDDPKKRDTVSFTSDAPVELIVGNTNKITGSISMDDSLDFSKQPFSAVFDVDLASIDTGIALRNEHMRDNFLETKKFPKATFRVKSVSAATTQLKPGKKVTVQAVGDFTVHGKTVSKTVPVDVTYFEPCKQEGVKFPDCAMLQIRAELPVAFKDHDIKRPEIVFQKLADTVFVKISATARAVKEEAKGDKKADKKADKNAKKNK